ncbi:putative mediator of RNA polymerase II transcription subunit 29 [Mytilus edulis]|uniref:putative mediator of RNA polymerase II transcription subunit 29 n=1 Tax=Mytilus edulis TaxID=6550 RepID=UPI0039F04F4D
MSNSANNTNNIIENSECNKQGHRQAECNSHLHVSESDEKEDDNSDEDKSETEDSVQTSQSILQPIPNDSQSKSPIAPLSKDQTDTSTNKGADNNNTYNHDSGLEAINNNTSTDDSKRKKKKKKLTNYQNKDDKAQGDISQYFQGSNQTPKNKTDKRNATTPTEEYQERTGPGHKTFKS